MRTEAEELAAAIGEALEIADGTPEESDPKVLDDAITDIANLLHNTLESYRAGDYGEVT